MFVASHIDDDGGGWCWCCWRYCCCRWGERGSRSGGGDSEWTEVELGRKKENQQCHMTHHVTLLIFLRPTLARSPPPPLRLPFRLNNDNGSLNSPNSLNTNHHHHHQHGTRWTRARDAFASRALVRVFFSTILLMSIYRYYKWRRQRQMPTPALARTLAMAGRLETNGVSSCRVLFFLVRFFYMSFFIFY